MSDLVPIRRALLSVSDKTELVPFARALAELGVELVSTGGTRDALERAELRVLPVERLTGFPEMMGGRVKTLHPAVHGAILARRDEPTHVTAMRDHGITPIDLVCVNLYPFHRAASEKLDTDAAIELIDIGGPAMVRSAAKNHAFVAVVTSPGQYDEVLRELRRSGGSSTAGLRRRLAARAFAHTAEYDAAIASWLEAETDEEAEAGAPSEPLPLPPTLRVSRPRTLSLRYGENPHQRAALYADERAAWRGVVGAALLHGKPLSYNNILDAAAALDLVVDLHLHVPGPASAAVVKHTNPCGAAVDADPAGAFRRAYEGDPLAAFGGILALGRAVDAAVAEAIVEGRKFLEVIVAPGFDDAARALLAERWKNVRLLAVGELPPAPPTGLDLRSVSGGTLAQDRDAVASDPGAWTHAAGPALDEVTRREALFAWLAAKHLKSNAVAIARAGQLLGVGAGQVDRVTAARLAVEKAGERLATPGADRERPAVAASDGFFPFPDGPERLINAGVSVIVQPGGSMRDEETIALCDARGVTCLMTGVRHFRH